MKTKTIVSEVQHILKWREDDSGKNQTVSDTMVPWNHRMNTNHCLESEQVSKSLFPSHSLPHIVSSVLGESPPPPPRACFGRDELIERVVSLAEVLNPIALIGAGGIGKTSIALTVLHHSRIKERFGDNRRFIRCDQFTASRANFLNRFSKAVGAGIENPEDLIPLRPFLSSKEMFIVLDNAESILDPQDPEGQEIYGVVEELSQIGNICLVITSRITTVPPDCKCLDIPTISMDAARRTFHRIYENSERPDLVDQILGQLDFHPLSVTLLATVAHQNKWNNDRLTREWEQRRTGVLQPRHSKSLAYTIELSLASPMFKQLGPDARNLLGVIAFFPQGINENNLDWLFPTTPNGAAILDAFCVLSLTYRLNGFVTMLVPLRDYLRPGDPLSSPLLRATKEYYFIRLSAVVDPDTPGFGETRWITSEDVNVEHLLNVLTSIDPNSDDVCIACADFLEHLRWHKTRQTVLGPKIEALPDDHPSKPRCLRELARLIGSAGNCAERKRLLERALKLERERGGGNKVALTLSVLSDANRMVGLYGEGINQAKEALEIYERIGDTANQGDSLMKLAWLLCADEQLDAAEEAASGVIDLLEETGQEYLICQSHQVLGNIHRSKGRREDAIHHYETAIEVATPPNWKGQLFWTHYFLAELFLDQGDFNDAHAHIERAKSCTVDNAYNQGRAVELQATVYHRQHRFSDATSETLRALEIYRELGALKDAEGCEHLLRDIEGCRNPPSGSNPAVSPWKPCLVPHPLTLFPACVGSTPAGSP